MDGIDTIPPSITTSSPYHEGLVLVGCSRRDLARLAIRCGDGEGERVRSRPSSEASFSMWGTVFFCVGSSFFCRGSVAKSVDFRYFTRKHLLAGYMT